jgi:hypothetical protein
MEQRIRQHHRTNPSRATLDSAVVAVLGVLCGLGERNAVAVLGNGATRGESVQNCSHEILCQCYKIYLVCGQSRELLHVGFAD